jgi:hypothetical protein
MVQETRQYDTGRCRGQVKYPFYTRTGFRSQENSIFRDGCFRGDRHSIWIRRDGAAGRYREKALLNKISKKFYGW